jgi:signal peptidase I
MNILKLTLLSKYNNIVLVCTFLLCSILATRLKAGTILYINNSPSAPYGIYLVWPSNINYGNYLIIKEPTGKLPRKMLLKQVYGCPGDLYEVNEHKLTIRNKVFSVYSNKQLPHLPLGKHLVPTGQLLLLNDYEYSYDSRYFGPVNIKDVVSPVVLLVNYTTLDSFMKKLNVFLRR